MNFKIATLLKSFSSKHILALLLNLNVRHVIKLEVNSGH